MATTTTSRTTAGSSATGRQIRRNQLIDAARTAFSTHGYHGATMTTVGAFAKVTKPILYQHFSNKLDLYLAVVQQSLDDLTTTLSEVLATTKTELDSIHATVSVLFDLADRNNIAVHDLLLASVPDEPSVEWHIRSAMTECTTTIATRIRLHNREAADARLLAWALLGASLTAARHWRQAGRPIPKHQAVETMTEWYWSGLRSQTGRGKERASPGTLALDLQSPRRQH